MSRTKPRNRPQVGIESLEARVVLSGGLNGQAQYMLDLLNMVRTDPKAASQWVGQGLDAVTQNTIAHYNVDLSNVQSDIAGRPAQPPLAYSDVLGQAATGHSQDQANTGVESHIGSDGSDLATRLDRVGYTGAASSTENAFAYADSVDQAMQSFLIDWGVSNKGHLDNILQPGTPSGQAFTQVGFGIVQTDKTNIGPLVVTQDFARPAGTPRPYILGAVFADLQHDNLDHPGEGVAGATVIFTKLDDSGQPTDQVTTVQTWDGGGYQQELDPGRYNVQAMVNGQVVGSQTVTLGSQNVDVRFDTTQAPPAPVPAPVPVSAPTPAPVSAPAPDPVSAPAMTDSAPAVGQQLLTMSAPVEASVIVPDVSTSVPIPIATPITDSGAGQSSILSFIKEWSTWAVQPSKAQS